MAKTENKRPTPKQMALVDIIMTHENISVAEAGRLAGFSEKNAAQTASRALALPHVQAYYQEQLAARTKRTGIDADYVLRRLAEIDEMDIADIYDAEGKMLPPHKWPKVWRRNVKEVDLKTGKIKLQEKLKTLELIGKHVGVRAFAELVEVDVKDGFGERLAKARAKLKGEQ